MWYDVQREVRRVEMGQASELTTTILRHPETQGLHRMWDELRGDRPVPFRAELDAHKIGAKAPFLAILEYVGPSNFRIRIAGDRLNKWFGMELRGMSALALLDTASRNHFQATLNRVTADPAVAVLHGAARGADGFSARFELILLPMRSDFGRVDRVLVGLWLIDAPATTRGPLRLEPDAFTVAPILSGAPAAEEPAAGEAAEAGTADAVSGLEDTPDRPDAGDAPLPPLRLPTPRIDRLSDVAAEEPAPESPPPRGPDGPGRRGHLRLVKKS